MFGFESWNTCISMCTDATHIWYVATCLQAIMEVDVFTGQTRCRLVIPDCKDEEKESYRAIANIGSHLYLMPYENDYKILDYDLKTSLYTYIEIPKNLFLEGEENPYFNFCAINDTSIVIFGKHPVVLVYNTLDKEFISFRDWANDVNRNDSKAWLINGWNFNQGVLFASIYNSNYFLRIDIRTGNYIVLSTKLPQKGSYDIEYDGEKYWISPSYLGGNVICWDIRSGIPEYSYFDMPYDSDGRIITCKGGLLFFIKEKGIILLPSMDEESKIYFINKNSDIEIDDIPITLNNNLMNFFNINYGTKVKDSNGIYWTIHYDTSTLVSINSNDGKVEVKQLHLEEKEKAKLASDIIARSEKILINETDLLELSGFLKYVNR